MRGFRFDLQQQLMAGAAIVATAVATPAQAQTRDFDVPAQAASRSIPVFARQAGVQIIASGNVVRGRRTNAVRGSYTVEEGLRTLLQETGLEAGGADGTGIITIRAAGTRQGQSSRQLESTPSTRGSPGSGEAEAGGAAADSESAEILVTGSRIRGGVSPSPRIEVTAEQARNGGFTDLGQVIRSLPQNFAGGQNPGVAIGAGNIANQNISQASALNLRGLGPDATLTLLNGRRLSYNGFSQAVDVSVVPLGALARIEIVPDGASAIYGSDAVAGVANIILRRDLDGLETTAMAAFPTDGGGEEYQLSATGGTRWASGGIILAYEYTDAEAILADQRSYTAYMADPATLVPDRRQHSALVSLHHEFGPSVEFRMDGLYTHRSSTGTISTQLDQRLFQGTRSEIYAVAPSLEVGVAAGWSLTVGGVYARDRTDTRSRLFELDGTLVEESTGCYCNTSYSLEVDGEGPLFRLPGGDLRLAIGGGYRHNQFELTSESAVERGSRGSYYAYGELLVPLVSPDMGVAGVHRLSATAALRFEDYDEIGSITTPKVGLVYEPTADFSLRGSWGRSFKAPTLLQQYSEPLLFLLSAEQVGGVGFPPGATVLLPYGGNRDLRPERAETWSATLAVHLRAVPGLRLELGYFDVDYRDRVVQPIEAIFRTLDEPGYAQFITFDPSADLLAQLVASSPTGVSFNLTDAPYDPADVVAVAYNNYVNVARSTVRGLDLSATYSFALAAGEATITGAASRIEGSQQSSPDQPRFPTVGRIFNPPEFSARAGLVWTRGGLTLAGFVNHLGSVLDNQVDPPEQTGSFTTIDATVRYRTGAARGPLANVELALSAHNIFDQAPPRTAPLADYVVNYDSTNFSPIGRVVRVSLTKIW